MYLEGVENPLNWGWKLASLLCGSKGSQILSFEDSDHVSMEWKDLGKLVEVCQEADVHWTHTAALNMILQKTKVFWLKAEKEENTA